MLVFRSKHVGDSADIYGVHNIGDVWDDDGAGSLKCDRQPKDDYHRTCLGDETTDWEDWSIKRPGCHC